MRQRTGRWPADRPLRWTLRLAFGLPAAVFGWWVAGRQGAVPNDALAVRSGLVDWGSSQLSWVGQAWPPIPIGLAALVNGSVTALAVVGGLASGGLVHGLVERMTTRRVPVWLIVLGVLAVYATPVMAYLATADLAEFLGLMFMVTAMSGFLRFVLWGRTEGGFQAGLLLGLATACDITAVVYALLLGAAGPFFAHRRYRGQPGSARATVAVIVFPSVAAAAAWAFLEWRFTGDVFAVVRLTAFQFPDGVSAELLTALREVGHGLLLAPSYLVVGVLLFRRSPVAVIGYLLPLLGLVLTLWLGLRPESGLLVAMLGCLALLAVPSRPRPIEIAVLTCTLVVQWVLAFTLATAWVPSVGSWWALVLPG